MPRLNLLRRAYASMPLALLLVAGAAQAAVVRTFSFSRQDVRVEQDARGFARYSLTGSQPWGVQRGPEIPAVSVLVDLPVGQRAVSVHAEAVSFEDLGSNGQVRPLQPDVPSGLKAAWA